MANALVYNDRLPGVLCETGVPSRTPNPLRLDVAGFVGFAERGPVDVPVLIEDFSQYRMVFGGDLPLALVDGRPVYAHLPRTVETFFETGADRQPDLIKHQGEEFIFVLEGRVEALTEFYEPTVLEAGDSMYIDSTMAHNLRALDGKPARVLNISSASRRLPDE